MHNAIVSLWILFAIWCTTCVGAQPVRFRVATYNVQNYLLKPTETRDPKPESARAKVQELIIKLNADLIGLQEIGGREALEELQTSLRVKGLDYPHAEIVPGFDTNIMVAVLSKLPFVDRRPHTNDIYQIDGKPYFISRGIAQVTVEPKKGTKITIFVAHLKSRRAIPNADQARMRLEEAKILRKKVDDLLAVDPRAMVIVMGDLNDTKDSPTWRVITSTGRARLLDTRPAELSWVRQQTILTNTLRTETWTHFYSVQDVYSRVDYILCSYNLAKMLVPDQCYVLDDPDWGLASDHRPVVVTFMLN